MSTATVAINQQLTTGQKVTNAIQLATQTISLFSPQVGAALELGVSLEPLALSIENLFSNIFRHHSGMSISS